jgi:DNA-binding beta-propeller fold protein YncE
MYSIDQSTGALTSITTAVASGTAPTGISSDPTGRFVYVTNQNSTTISMYSINQSTGALTTITTAIGADFGPGGITCDPTGRFVYAVNYASAVVSVYSINNFSAGAGTFAGNVLASGVISAAGNITGGNILGGANVNATTHTGNTVSVTGNIAGGNIALVGLVSAGGNVRGGNINAVQDISAFANVIGGNVFTDGIIKTTTKTFATLPAAATIGAGARSFISDANTATFGSQVTSGGANAVPVWTNGTNWYVG